MRSGSRRLAAALGIAALSLGCTTRLLGVPDPRPTILRVNGLEVRAERIERPDDWHPVFNRPFHERGLLAVSVMFENRGHTTHVVDLANVRLELPNGTQVSALSPGQAARVMARGGRRLLYGFPLFENVRYGYLKYALSARSSIGPGEAAGGYVFFRLYNGDDGAGGAGLSIQLTELGVLRTVEYAARLHGGSSE